MEPLFQPFNIKAQTGSLTVSVAFLPYDQFSLGGSGACTVAALYLVEALHYVQGQGLLPTPEHYSQIWQLAVHKWKLVQKAMYTATTTYGDEFPDGYLPVTAAIQATGLPIKQLVAKIGVSIMLKGCGLDAFGLSSFDQVLQEMLEASSPALAVRHFVMVYRGLTFHLSIRRNCQQCGSGQGPCACKTRVTITDSLGSTLVENGTEGYVLRFGDAAGATNCAINLALNFLQWRFVERYALRELKGDLSRETFYRKVAIEISEVTFDATTLASTSGAPLTASKSDHLVRLFVSRNLVTVVQLVRERVSHLDHWFDVSRNLCI
jgi:hypothetical protein